MDEDHGAEPGELRNQLRRSRDQSPAPRSRSRSRSRSRDEAYGGGGGGGAPRWNAQRDDRHTSTWRAGRGNGGNGGGDRAAPYAPRERGPPPSRDGAYTPSANTYHFRNLATIRNAFVDTYSKLFALHSDAVRGKPVTPASISEAMSVAGRVLACPVCFEIVDHVGEDVYVAGCAHAFHKVPACWRPGVNCPACPSGPPPR